MIDINDPKFYVGSTNLNTFIDSPAKWFVEFYLGVGQEPNIYALRGQAVENVVNDYLNSVIPSALNEIILKHSAIYQDKTKGLPSPYGEIDISYILNSSPKLAIDQICEIFNTAVHGVPSTQKCVTREIEGLRCRALTDYYLDIEGSQVVVDLKSKSKLPKVLNNGGIASTARPNIRQQVFYHMIGDFNEMSLLYVTDKETLIYKLTEEDYAKHIPVIKKALKNMKKILTLPPEDAILHISRPTESDFKWGFWSQKQIEEAKYIWELN